jgi:hypothetical protein
VTSDLSVDYHRVRISIDLDLKKNQMERKEFAEFFKLVPNRHVYRASFACRHGNRGRIKMEGEAHSKQSENWQIPVTTEHMSL